MKKMTIEEKAKAYDELIKRLKDFQSEYKFKTIEEHFPELKELDDERIREALIKYFSEGREYLSLIPYNKEECVAWLEKQKNIDVLDEEEREFADNVDSYRKEIDAAYQKGYNEGVKITLEKHGEQKPADKVEPKFNIGDIIFNKKTKEQFAITDRSLVLQYYHDYDHLHEVRFSEQDDWEIIKPKFHKGDWVFIEEVDGYKQGPFQIKEITQYGYPFDKRRGVMPFEYESLMTIWTIADAKDGDVLVNGSNIFIFHYFNGTRLMGYCHVNTDDERFYDDLGKNECFCLIDAIVNPATKEQRDMLFQKMKEAGYKWDAEKKELKKVEQKLAEWSKEDEEYLNFVIATMKTLQVKCTENEIKHHSSSQAAPYYAKVINWLKSLKPQKQKWSEKDTEILNGIANYLFTSTDVSNIEGSDEWYDWLKSLKNRVQNHFN